MFETGRFPILTVFEGLYFYAWVLITLSLVINRLLRVDFIVFFTNVIGLLIMAIHTFAPLETYIRCHSRSSLCQNYYSFILQWQFYLMVLFHYLLFFPLCIYSI